MAKNPEKQLAWKLKTFVLQRLEERGASFLEIKFIESMIKDSVELKIDEPSRDNEDIAKEVVDYYLSEIFKPPEDPSVVSEYIAEKTDESGIAQSKIMEDAKKTEKDGAKIPCSLCGKEYKVLYPHLLAKHHLTPENYRKMFPNSPLRAGVPEHKKSDKKKKKIDVEEKMAKNSLKDRIVRLANFVHLYEK